MQKKTWIIIGAIVAVIVVWFIGTRNSIVRVDEDTNNMWGNVETAYQRRYDLIPQLESTVKGAANYEKSTLTEVIEARSKASSVQISGDKLTEANVAAFQKAQDNLQSALNKAISVTVERYPELTATETFKTFMVQVEGTENRISVARKNYNDAVQSYNKKIRMFPASIVANMRGVEKKGYFKSDEAAATAQKVDFSF